MLQSIHVKNIALIEETEVEFGKGFNVITGETGAGKSLLIGSVNLALGGKFDTSMLRKGTDSGFVELVFDCSDKKTVDIMEDMDIPVEDGLIIISRKFSSEKSSSRINGQTVTLKQVRELAENLIDIHGQHEHQSLLKKSKHLEILDAYGEENSEGLLKAVKTDYEEWKKAKEALEEADTDVSSVEREKSLLEFECNEIENAQLKEGEDEELEDRYRIMSNSRKILDALNEAYSATSSDTDMGCASAVGNALRSISTISDIDDKLAGLHSQLTDIESLLNDFNREISSYLSDYDFEEEEFAEVEQRLDLINDLKRKYGKSVEKIIEYYNAGKEKLLKYQNFDAYIENLKKDEKIKFGRLLKDCDKLSGIRRKMAEELTGKLKDALVGLNFLSVDFKIDVRSLSEPTAKGMDDVEFLISTNPGESVKPLSDVASGGELSRIMLAIKTVLAKKDSIDTLIFDEIDSGISGKTAWKVSEQIGLLSREHQVLCITHLPQIAAMGDVHLVIEKNTDLKSTTTTVRRIKDNESISELARLLGSDEQSEAAITNARDMKKKADDYKADI